MGGRVLAWIGVRLRVEGAWMGGMVFVGMGSRFGLRAPGWAAMLIFICDCLVGR